MTNTAIFSTPLVTPAVKPSNSKVATKSNTALNSLGPGTLILANGNIVPILPQTPILQPQAIIHQPPIIVNSSPANNTTLFIVPNNLNTSTVKNTSNPISLTVSTVAINTKMSNILSKNYSNIRPKTNVTKTTQINKVPIPALSSQFSVNLNKVDKVIPKKVNAKQSNSNKNVVTDTSSDKKVTTKRLNYTNRKKFVESKRLKLQPDDAIAISETPTSTTNTIPIEADTNRKSNKTPYSIDSLFNVNNEKSNTNKENIKSNSQEIDVQDTSAHISTSKTSESKDSVPKESNETTTNQEVADVTNIEKIIEKVPEEPNEKEGEFKQSECVEEVCDQTNAISSLETNVTELESTVPIHADAEENVVLTPIKDLNAATTDTNILIPTTNAELTFTADDVTKCSTENVESVHKPTETLNAKVAESTTNSEKNTVDDKQKETQKEKSVAIHEKIQENVHSDLSNDLFAHLQVPTGSQNPESTSPTAAFLLAFPLVSSLTGVKVTEVMEDEGTDSCHETPTLLQIGTMDTTKPIQTQSDSLTPNLLNLDSFTFFSSKDMCSNFYQPFETTIGSSTTTVSTISTTTATTTTATACVTQKSSLENKSRVISSIAPQTTTIITSHYDSTKSIYSTANITTLVSKDVSKLHAKSANDNYASSNTFNMNQSQYCGIQNNIVPNTSSKNTAQKTRTDSKASCRQYSSSAKSYGNIDNYNTFNPFTELSKSTACCYDTTKSFNEPFISSNMNYNYTTYQSDINFDVNYAQMKMSKNDTKQNFCNYDQSYIDYKNLEISSNLNTSTFYNHTISNVKQKNPNTKQTKSNINQSKGPVNWMTTPDIKQSNDSISTHYNKEIDFTSNVIYTSTFVTAPQSTYFNANSTIYPDIQNNFDNRKPTIDTYPPAVTANPFPRNDNEENRFSWSPTKLPQLLEPPGFVPSTLPSLVGDLALGNTSQIQFNEQKVESKHVQRSKDAKRYKSHLYENQSNFLSVSQLVDHNKPMHSVQNSNRVTHRRNSGNRSTKPSPPQKSGSSKRNQKTDTSQKETSNMITQNYNTSVAKSTHVKHQYNNQDNNHTTTNEWDNDLKQMNRQNKNASSYSAEALIGNQNMTDITKTRHQAHNNFPISSKSLNVAPFLTDNILPYFPPVDLPTQDNNFIQQNSTYQTNTFTHNFSTTSTYSTTSLMQTPITNSYLPSTNFIPEITSHDYNPMIATDNVNIFSHSNMKPNEKSYKSTSSTKQLSQSGNRNDEKRNLSQNSISNNYNTITNNNSNNNNNSNTFTKKTKRKISNENNLPGFVDFGFLSMQNAISSPILPDDFHTHSNFLPPPPPPPPTQTQLYPCKNTLYTKQNDGISSSLLPLPTVSRNNMQIDIAPTMNNVGTSLTNFNLSTIFPEMNKVSELINL